MLAAAIASNLVVLAWFKYAGFAFANLDGLDRLLGGAGLGSFAPVALPIGVSFIVFEKITYVVDVYRRTGPLARPAGYLLYVLLFPKLLAGPIIKYHDIAPQLARRPRRFDELGLGLVALLSDAFAFRAFGRVEAVVPAGLLFALASSLGVDRLRMQVTALWLAAAIATVAFLRAAHAETVTPWLGGGQRSRIAAVAAGAVGIGTVAIVAGLVFGPAIPGAGAKALVDTRNRSGDGSSVLSPLVSIQARLVNRSNLEMFTVRADQPAYWRLMSLDSFDGKDWTASDDFSDTPVNRGGTVNNQTFRIADLGDIYVPAAFAVSSFSSSDSLEFDAATSTLIRRSRLYRGMTYTVESSLPAVGPDELRSVTVGREADQQLVQLPDSIADEWGPLVAQITAGATTPYDQALALQNWFRSEFEYNPNVPRGHGRRAIETFLNAREGYCEQFSGTFAVFARILGIPARVAVGFSWGDQDSSGLWHVRGKHAHAWPEVYFDGIGWIPFEPTPGRGAPGAEAWTGVAAEEAGGVVDRPADNAPAANGNGTGNQGAPTTTVAVTRTTLNPLNVNEPGTKDLPGNVTTGAASTRSAGPPAWLGPVGIVLAAIGLWLLVMPPIARAIRRRRIGSRPTDRISAAWASAATALELVDAGRRPDETPTEHAERAWRYTGVDSQLLFGLANQVTLATYSTNEPTDAAADDAEAVAQRISQIAKRRAGWRRRLGLRWNPVRAARLP